MAIPTAFRTETSRIAVSRVSSRLLLSYDGRILFTITASTKVSLVGLFKIILREESHGALITSVIDVGAILIGS